MDDRLEPHREDIVVDLESKLWQVCEGFDYDPSLTKESTYLMRALLNYCERHIRRQYIGTHVGWKSMRGRHFYNITDVGYATLHNNNAAVEQDRRETEEVGSSVLDMIGGVVADSLERAYIKGERQVDIGKDRMSKARRDIERFLANLQKHNPQKFEDCIATLGRKAV
jgi:hypothetical protein